MAKPIPLFSNLMRAVEYHRTRQGLTMLELEELAGLSEGYYSKMLHASSQEGRCGSLAMVQKLCDALFVNGRCGVRLMAREPARQPSMEKINRGLRTHFRAYLMELGRKGAQRRNEKLSPAERSANARHAARVRWRRKRLEAKRNTTPASSGTGGTPRAPDRGHHAPGNLTVTV